MKSEFADKINHVKRLVREHDKVAEDAISLLASGNVVSPAVLELMQSDLIYRAAEGKGDKSIFPGLTHFYEIEAFAEKEVAKAFNAGFAELRPISGSQANLIALTSLSNVGDTILVPSIRSGGHVSTSGRIIKELRDYNLIRIRNEKGTLQLDREQLITTIDKEKPAILLLGGSMFHDWDPFMKTCFEHVHQHGGKVIFDVSHVAGLIATKTFPNPLDYGADLLTTTTCKTIPGPSHGWIIGKAEYQQAIDRSTFPGFVSGGHLQEYVGAIVSLFEILKYGKDFGEQIIKNANVLGKTLEEGEFSVHRTMNGNYSETHQVITSDHGKLSAHVIEEELSKIGIFVNANLLPEHGFKNKFGLRFGTQELTRLGGNETITASIGNLINDFLREDKPNYESYRSKVLDTKALLRSIKYY
ncbi:MAG: hypothetical protein MK105_12475 [Crocinitomicaceae bacterium]|nr:hypothetical protein [Crocinitomicaceae bacterium]